MKQAHVALPALCIDLNDAEQTRLFNYLHSNINFSCNKRLHAHTDQHKRMLLDCCNTLHYITLQCSSNVSQLEYGTLLPTNGKNYHMPLTLAVVHLNKAETAKSYERRKCYLSVYVVYIFALFVLFAFYLLNCEEQRQTYIAFDCIRLVCTCSQSVSLIVDIHLSLTTLTQMGL